MIINGPPDIEGPREVCAAEPVFQRHQRVCLRGVDVNASLVLIAVPQAIQGQLKRRCRLHPSKNRVICLGQSFGGGPEARITGLEELLLDLWGQGKFFAFLGAETAQGLEQDSQGLLPLAGCGVLCVVADTLENQSGIFPALARRLVGTGVRETS